MRFFYSTAQGSRVVDTANGPAKVERGFFVCHCGTSIVLGGTCTCKIVPPPKAERPIRK